MRIRIDFKEKAELGIRTFTALDSPLIPLDLFSHFFNLQSQTASSQDSNSNELLRAHGNSERLVPKKKNYKNEIRIETIWHSEIHYL